MSILNWYSIWDSHWINKTESMMPVGHSRTCSHAHIEQAWNTLVNVVAFVKESLLDGIHQTCSPHRKEYSIKFWPNESYSCHHMGDTLCRKGHSVTDSQSSISLLAKSAPHICVPRQILLPGTEFRRDSNFKISPGSRTAQSIGVEYSFKWVFLIFTHICIAVVHKHEEI